MGQREAERAPIEVPELDNVAMSLGQLHRIIHVLMIRHGQDATIKAAAVDNNVAFTVTPFVQKLDRF